MTRNPIGRAGIVLLSLSLWLPLSPLAAEDEKELRGLLREALYTEEVTRDAEAAAKQYEALLSQHDAQRAFAASALFRLAEVRRKQDRKDDAIALYQKLLARFPEAETEAKLARENLAALGGKPPEGNGPADDAEDKELKRLQELARTNPDAIRDPSIVSKAVRQSWLRVLKFFLEKNPGFDLNVPTGSNRFTVLDEACDAAALEACRMLLDAGADPNAPANRGVLTNACSDGHLRIVELLLERGADPGGHGTQDPLKWAVLDGHQNIVSLLVKKGADLNLPFQTDAAADGSIDLNHRIGSRTFGSPLHVAAAMEDTRMVEFLLKLGADPNLAETSTGLTALHIAANSVLLSWSERADYPGNPAAIPLLLKAGAKPDPETKAFVIKTTVGQEGPTYPAGITPLVLAVRSGNVEAARRLIEAGASAKRPGLAPAALKQPGMLELLLKHGADPNEQDERGDSILLQAVMNNDLPAVRLLLETGADPNKGDPESSPLANALFIEGRQPMAELLLAKGARPGGPLVAKAIQKADWKLAMRLLDAGAPLPEMSPARPEDSPFIQALKSAEALPLVQRMVTMGAKPEEAWIKSGFRQESGGIPFAVRSYLFRTFILPQLEESDGIRAVDHDSFATKVSLLEEKSTPALPRLLSQLLLDPKEALQWAGRVKPGNRLTLWRKTDGAWKAAQEFAMSDDFPALEWGDVIELSDESEDWAKAADPFSVRGSMTPELRWALLRRIAIPVTVEIDGKVQEITLRGDRLIHDPTSTGVPWCTAGSLAHLRWQPAWPLDPAFGMSVVVIRKGWPEVRLPFPSEEASKFALKSGDHVKMETPGQAIQTMTALRKKFVEVRGVGMPYGWMVRCAGGNNLAGNGRAFPAPLIPSMVPTLCQVIAETQVVPKDWAKYSTLPADSIPANFQAFGTPVTVLPHPDWSRIRIRRLKEDGSEEAIEVNLARIIEGTDEDTTVDEIKKHDVQLQPGDVVEIRVHEDRLGQPWKGLSTQEESFFAKATQGRVQVIGQDSKVRLEEVRLRAPAFVETPAGWFPLPPKGGIQGVRAAMLMGEDINIEMMRNGETYEDVDPSDVFLRDGDQMKNQRPGGSQRPRSAAPIPAPSR